MPGGIISARAQAVMLSHHDSAQTWSWLKRAYSWPVRMAGNGQGTIPTSQHCTSAWGHHRGGTRTVLCPTPPPRLHRGSSPPQLPALTVPGWQLNILVGNLWSQEVCHTCRHPSKSLPRKMNHFKVNPAIQDEVNLIQTILSAFTSGIYTGAASLTLSWIS